MVFWSKVVAEVVVTNIETWIYFESRANRISWQFRHGLREKDRRGLIRVFLATATGRKVVSSMKIRKNEDSSYGITFGEKIKSSVLEMLSLRCLLHICIGCFLFPLCNKRPEV